jgi:hypothetical protein
VIEGPLEDAPDTGASTQELEDHVIKLNHTIAVKNLMYESVAPYWQNIYQNHIPWDMISALVSRFTPQARVSKFECIDEFHSKKLEEGASVEEHLLAMTRLYRRLADVFDYQIDDEQAIDVLMISLPPSYHGFVENYVKGNVEMSWDDFLDHLRAQVVVPDEGEIIDDEGILDILVINASYLNTCDMIGHMMLIPVLLENRSDH